MNTEALYELYKKHPKVSTDSRSIEAGDLFFALKGDHFNGNLYAGDAIAKGAAYAVVDDPAVVQSDAYILVEDVLTVLQHLARHHRRQFTIPVIGITGSNGKTTTKELVSAVLGSQYKLHFTQGNLNNHIGVPLTLLSIPMDIEVAVIEMGANHQGEINFLCEIAEPSHGLITNIGKAHLEGFGGIEGVKKGKSELYRFLGRTGGMAFINKDAQFLESLAESVKKKVFYRKSASPSMDVADLEVGLVAAIPFIEVAFLDRATQQLVQVQTNLHGIYNFDNIMTAIAIGKYFKVPGQKIKAAIASYTPSNNRSQLLQKGTNTFVMDAYNANPTSMRAALHAFANMEATKKIAVIGSMLELGEESMIEHHQIAALAKEQAYDHLILIGREFKESALKHDLPHFEDVSSLKAWFDQQSFDGFHIFLKGSRGIRLEQLIS
jgi:UDP-N-acetylmuramoyl-tripeptide--D-alanyl-D-alanine ligase